MQGGLLRLWSLPSANRPGADTNVATEQSDTAQAHRFMCFVDHRRGPVLSWQMITFIKRPPKEGHLSCDSTQCVLSRFLQVYDAQRTKTRSADAIRPFLHSS